MKSLITIILFSIGSTAYSQNSGTIINDTYVGRDMDRLLMIHPITPLTYDDVVGTPYHEKKFFDATISENYPVMKVRYNSYKDEVEFLSNEEVRVIPKEDSFNRIEFKGSNEVIVLKNLDGKKAGYFYELKKEDVSLYKKITTIFQEHQPAKSSYETAKPPTFRLNDPSYYFVSKTKILKNAKTQKDIYEFFPDKKNELKVFFKNNKIKFNNDKDMRLLAEFLK